MRAPGRRGLERAAFVAEGECRSASHEDTPATEARRQTELLAALLGPAPHVAAPGLHAYRAHAHAAAERALAAACPTVGALLGPEDFARLAREFWHAHPPLRGDLGEWGDALPAWIEAHPGLAEWPYLADCARLDLALHRCERAADASPDPASLALLAATEPARLHLRALPGVAVITSRWPLASIHAAHTDGDERLFDRARDRLRAGEGEAVVVARAGWRGAVHAVDAAGAAFLQAVLDGADLAHALDAAGDGFDFAGWLAHALRGRWLKDAVRNGD